MARGAFIVLEGLDRAGKSTQVNLLLNALMERKITAEKRNFPDRTEPGTGQVLNEFLSKKTELEPESAILLFSANRWQRHKNIRDALMKGTTLIVDRYAASGAAYASASSNRSLEWCKLPDSGLPAPDLVIFLEVKGETQQSRANWGEEHFERVEIQRKVAENFRQLANDYNWCNVEANRSIDDVHQDILKKCLPVIDDCKDKPIKILYENFQKSD